MTPKLCFILILPKFDTAWDASVRMYVCIGFEIGFPVLLTRLCVGVLGDKLRVFFADIMMLSKVSCYTCVHHCGEQPVPFTVHVV